MSAPRAALNAYGGSGGRKRRCECTQPGSLRCSVPGVLAGPPQGDGSRYIERCDTCMAFSCDEVAGLMYARVNGGACQYDRALRVVWKPQ
jgi:hypothetical protein